MKRFAAVVSALVLGLPLAATAHDHHEAAEAEPAAAAERTIRDDYMFVFNAAESKIKSLAGAFGEEHYGWRPAEGVRSVGEAFQHISAGIYFLSGMIGVEPPAEGPKTPDEIMALEENATKADVMASLEKAFAHAHHAIDSATPEQLAQEIDFFGNKIAGRTLLLVIADHNAEHLGQLIAYARSNGVTPPWSQAPEGGESEGP